MIIGLDGNHRRHAVEGRLIFIVNMAKLLILVNKFLRVVSI